jgi:hypothetical protein
MLVNGNTKYLQSKVERDLQTHYQIGGLWNMGEAKIIKNQLVDAN